MGRKPQTNDYSLLYERAARERDEARHGLRAMHIAADRFLRERDEARADAARWKAEADRLREAFDADAVLDAVAVAVPDGTLTEVQVERVAASVIRALSAGGGTDA